ncbi:MAG TPA: hypothetical protein VK979_05345 [Guyparkeria sp.]|nr:hypothetical protein [Guyparkeria sp.]
MTKYRNDVKKYMKAGLLLALVMGLLWLLEAYLRPPVPNQTTEQRIDQQLERKDRVAVLHYQIDALRDAVEASPPSVERGELIERINLFGRRANVVWGLEETEKRFEQLVHAARKILKEEDR